MYLNQNPHFGKYDLCSYMVNSYDVKPCENDFKSSYLAKYYVTSSELRYKYNYSAEEGNIQRVVSSCCSKNARIHRHTCTTIIGVVVAYAFW